MPHETQPKLHEDPLNTGAIALDEFNKTVRKKTAEATEIGISNNVPMKQLLQSLLKQFEGQQAPSPLSGEQVLESIQNLASEQIPTGRKSGIISGPLSNLLSGKLSFDRTITKPRGEAAATQIFKAQQEAGKQQRGLPKQQVDFLRAVQQLLQSSPEGAAAFERVKAESKAKFEESRKDKVFKEDIDTFIQGFEVAEQELVEVMGEKVLATGPGGKATRALASGAEFVDLLPKTSAFIRNIKVSANKMARTVEGGRVTDADRQVYADALANSFENPSEENTELIVTSLRGLQNKGGNISRQVESLIRSNSDTLRRAGIQLATNQDMLRRRLELMRKQKQQGVQ